MPVLRHPPNSLKGMVSSEDERIIIRYHVTVDGLYVNANDYNARTMKIWRTQESI